MIYKSRLLKLLKNIMTHKFKKIETPKYIGHIYGKFTSCKICKICNLVVANYKYDGDYSDDFFFSNGVEIFKDIDHLNEMKLNCDEIIIKNVLE